MPATNATFGTFIDGGDAQSTDIVVGLRNGLNYRFNLSGIVGAYLPLAGGTMSGDIDMDGNTITNVPAPSSSSAAVPKSYVDGLTAGEALTKVDDTNVTLTLGGTPLTALLHAASLTLGWTGQLAVPRGGTGDASFTAYSVICGGTTSTGALQSVSTLGNAGEQLTSNGAGALPTWQASGTVSPLTTKGDLYTFTTVNARLAVGTINGQFLQVNSATASGLAWSTATLPSTGGASGNILISDGTNYIASTSLWPNTVGTSGKFLISNGTSNGYSTSTIPTSSGATANKVLLSDGTNYVLSTPTFPNASATSGKIIISDGTNWIASTPTYPAAAGTSGNVLTSDGTNWLSSVPASTSLLTTKGDLFSFSTVDARLPVAVGDGKILQVSSGATTGLAYSTPTYPSASGTSGKILISDGTNNIYSTPTYPNSASTTGSFIYANGTNFVASTSLWPNTVGTAGKMIRSDGTTNAYTTSTFADTYSASNLLYSNGANTVTGLATANNGVLVTSAGGVPSISSNLPAGINLPSPFSVNSTSVTSTGTQLNLLNGLTVVPINKVSKQIFTSSGTYTVTPGMVYCIIEVLGGGGGGGGSAGAAGQGGGGGGGSAGAYARSVVTAATIGASQTVTIGAQAAGGTAGTNNGSNGNTCSLGSIVSAGGGTGGTGAASVAAAQSTSSSDGSSTATGDFTSQGQAGFAGITLSGVGGTIVGGQGGSTLYGAGGRGRVAVGTGITGSGYGAGGGGGVGFNGTAAAGGTGALGVVIITEFISS